MAFHRHLHAVLQEGGTVADPVLCEFDLLVGFIVHEGQHPVILVEILVVLLLKADALHRFGRTETLIEFPSVDEVLQFDLCESAALAGLHVLDLNRRPEAALVLDDVAGTDFVAVDLHGTLEFLKRI